MTITEQQEIMARRIKSLLEERGMTQQELAKRSNTSPSAISDWIGTTKKGKSPREPKIMGLKAVAEALGVSVDYLLGADECKIPTDEEIHRQTGLSDKALEKLKKLQQSEGKDKGHAARKLEICNFLLETIDETKLFEDLHNYLLREFYFNNGKTDLGATAIYARGIDGEESEVLAFAETYGHVFLSQVFQDLAILRKITDSARLERQKADRAILESSGRIKKFED